MCGKLWVSVTGFNGWNGESDANQNENDCGVCFPRQVGCRVTVCKKLRTNYNIYLACMGSVNVTK